MGADCASGPAVCRRCSERRPTRVTTHWVEIDRLIGGAGGQRVAWWHGPLEIFPA